MTYINYVEAPGRAVNDWIVSMRDEVYENSFLTVLACCAAEVLFLLEAIVAFAAALIFLPPLLVALPFWIAEGCPLEDTELHEKWYGPLLKPALFYGCVAWMAVTALKDNLCPGALAHKDYKLSD
jgi:hypothetical protein